MTPTEGDRESSADLFAGFLQGDLERVYGHFAQAENPAEDPATSNCTGVPNVEVSTSNCTGVPDVEVSTSNCTGVPDVEVSTSNCTGVPDVEVSTSNCTGVPNVEVSTSNCTGVPNAEGADKSDKCTAGPVPPYEQPPRHASWLTGA